MKKIIKTVNLIIVLVIALIVSDFFYACQKEDDKTTLSQNKQSVTSTHKERKSLDNFQQPTQIIDIQTFINIGEASYPICGNAVVGNYDGRIFECDLTGVIHVVETDEMVPIHLTAALKPEFEDFTVDVEPVMGKYIMIVNDIPVTQDYELIIPINTLSIEIHYQDIFNLWTEIVGICSTNIVIVYPFILDESMLPYQYAVYEHDLPIAFTYIETIFNSYTGDEKGYFTLSFKDTNALIFYGFVTELSIHFNPIWTDSVYIDEPDDDGGGLCFKVVRKKFDNYDEAWEYAIEKIKIREGNSVNIYKDPNTGEYIVSYDDGEPPVHP